MFSILDRYIIRSFLYSFLVCAVALIGLMMVLHAFLRLKDFMEAAHAQAGPGFGVLSVMVKYYAARLPVYFHTMSPAILLTAAMFCMAQFNKNNELVPMRASGISLFRTLVPLFVFAVLLTGVLFLVQETVIPALVPRIKYTEAMLEGGAENVYEDLDLYDPEGNNWDLPRFRRGEDVMAGKILLTRYYPETDGSRHAVMTRIQAESAVWKRTATDGVPRWHLQNGEETRRDADGSRISAADGNYNTRFGEGDDAYVVLRPDDVPDTPFRVVSSFRPRDIVDDDTSVLYQSSSRLRRLYAVDPTRREVGVALHSRYAFPISNIVLLLLGLPFVLNTESKSTFGGIVVCIMICAMFYGVHAVCTQLGKSTLSPVAAAWLPIALFGPVGIFLFDGVRT
ncbi:MAG TPA: LptF/LptG family permease [Planctomycetota bacterium]|nr:LptF/LptG family permease [Planctomycetota bacterium]